MSKYGVAAEVHVEIATYSRIMYDGLNLAISKAVGDFMEDELLRHSDYALSIEWVNEDLTPKEAVA